MSALLVKNPPDELRQWLKDEALSNRRSINQQVLVCLEWCMRMHGDEFPFDRSPSPSAVGSSLSSEGHHYLRGRELASRLVSIRPITAASATQMKKSVLALRKAKERRFNYACFA